jgi:hypothetical protein
MSQPISEQNVALAPANQLSGLDRCDSCGAEAYVRVTMASGQLFFCAHHGAKFKDKLFATAIEWHDESSKLLEGVRA